jgi:hypothetical protein
MPKLRNRKREFFAQEVAAMTPLAIAYVEVDLTLAVTLGRSRGSENGSD